MHVLVFREMSNMKMPLVSVLVPVYNVEKYLDECIDSIEKQTYKNIEVIFVNDGSTDRSAEVLKRREKNGYIIVYQQNSGLATARNTSLKYATGDFLTFLDSDDMLRHDSISNMVEAALKIDADIVRGRIVRFNSKWERLFSKSSSDDIIEFRKAFLDWGEFPLNIWGALYRRTLFTDNELTFYDGLNFGEDFGMNCRVAYFAKRVANIDSVVYRYRVNEQSMTQAYKEHYANELFEISDRIKAFYESKPDADLYTDVMKRGRARMKTIALLQLPKDISPKYAHVFPELRDAKGLPLCLRLKLRAMEHNNRTLYKIIHKLEGIFK